MREAWGPGAQARRGSATSSAGRRPSADGEEEEEEVSDEGADEGENEPVYVTEAHRAWECHYLRRLAKRIHRFACRELDSSEEALFMLFTQHDEDLNGVVSGDEVQKLMDTIEQNVPPTSSAASRPPVRRDGTVHFVDMLQWYSGESGGQFKETTAGFSLTSLTVGVLGSGMVYDDARIDKLGFEELRRNVVGYKRLWWQLRTLKEERLLAEPQAVESRTGTEEAMPRYYEVLEKEFEGDSAGLFELFSEADVNNNMLLEAEEVEGLLCLLDKDATEDDVTRYMNEINLSDGPLSFTSFVDWWDQAVTVQNSLVAEKGLAFMAGMRAAFASSKVSSFWSETAVKRRWVEAKKAGHLQALREAYCQTLRELREFKMERDLRRAEEECAQL